MSLGRACPTCGRIDCTEHKRKPWQGRPLRPRRGSGWSEQRENRGILAQHRGICHVCGQPGADQVDHVIPLSQGGADDPSNKRPIHGLPCHAFKTQGEALRGREP